MKDIGKKDFGGFVIPTALPDKIGFGCAHCDDGLLVDPQLRREELMVRVSEFFKKHRACGDLDILEKRGDSLVITGKLLKGEF